MADKSILSAFKQAPLFRQIEEEELEHFIENVTIATYKKGHYIFLQGETPDWMLLLLQGTIKVLRQTEMGRFVTFNILTPRQTWGEGIILPFSYRQDRMIKSLKQFFQRGLRRI